MKPSKIYLPDIEGIWGELIRVVMTMYNLDESNFPIILYKSSIKLIGLYSKNFVGCVFLGTSVTQKVLISLGNFFYSEKFKHHVKYLILNQ